MDEIENIYDPLNHYKVHEDSGEWINIDKTLSRINFYRFNIYKFNFYYILAIVLSMVVINVFLFRHKISVTHTNFKNDRSKNIPAAEAKEQSRSIPAEPHNCFSYNHDSITSSLQIPSLKRDSSQILSVAKQSLVEEKKNSSVNNKYPKSFIKSISKNKLSELQEKSDTKSILFGTEADTSLTIENTEKQLIQKEKALKKKPIKTIYLSKRDTIFSYDSIKVNPRKLRKQNKRLN